MQSLTESLSPEMLADLFALVTQWGLQVVGAILVLVIGRWVAGAVRNAVRRAMQRGSIDDSLIPFLSGIAS